jgi:hypothetical protein
MDKLVYSLDEVAEMTGWPKESIRRACQRGQYVHTRRGRWYGMTRVQIDAMIASHEGGNGGPRPVNQRDAEAAAIEAARQANVARLTRRGAA